MQKQTSENVKQGLTARQIFDKILKGGVVRIPNDSVLADQLYKHLNVIKSREKKLFSDLGFDFTASVIRIIAFCDVSELDIIGYDISLSAPKKRRTYPAFVIKEKENGSDSGTTV